MSLENTAENPIEGHCRDSGGIDCIQAIPLRSIPSSKSRDSILVRGCSIHDGDKDSNSQNPDAVLRELDDLLAQAGEYLASHPEACDSDTIFDDKLERGPLVLSEEVGDESKFFEHHSNFGDDEIANAKRDPKYNELVNFNLSPHDTCDRVKVKKLLDLFEEKYKELCSHRSDTECRKRFHIPAAESIKSSAMWIDVRQPFGHIPGVEIGDVFQFRSQLAVVGLHRQFFNGIDFVVIEGKKFATSIVNSGRYCNQFESSGVLIYSGQGGNSKFVDKVADQKLEKGNIAMFNSMEMGYPVRVISRNAAKSNIGIITEGKHVYVYDGLYAIHSFRQERDHESGKLVFKFELHRMEGQARSSHMRAKSETSSAKRNYFANDISEGKETFLVHASNDVDEDRLIPFIYITKVVYPSWYTFIVPEGCGCINGCSESSPCTCLMKNGGEIPYNESANIIKARPLVHECGPACRCPPSCPNRVSQHGIRYQLEIFKTKTKGWGVRSRNFISSGGFICEYVGELISDEEAELRVGCDEYLFDVSDKYTLDAKEFGNIGRFINHSCSPNVYAQEVVYDNEDRKVPHIMFFASKNIPPMRELFYDYNYKNVYDKDGNSKLKRCLCGSSECTGNMYLP